MKLFIDTEFTGLRKDSTLISIGVVSENNNEFYAEFYDYDKSQIDDWLKDNIIKNLDYDCNKYNFKLISGNKTIVYGNTKYIKQEFLEWLEQFDKIELVLDVGHYDYILLIDLLFGNALNIPQNFDKTYEDLNQLISNYYNISIMKAFNINRESLLDEEICGVKHNALYDANIIKLIYESIT